jgi:hypothetical protein
VDGVGSAVVGTAGGVTRSLAISMMRPVFMTG